MDSLESYVFSVVSFIARINVHILCSRWIPNISHNTKAFSKGTGEQAIRYLGNLTYQPLNLNNILNDIFMAFSSLVHSKINQ